MTENPVVVCYRGPDSSGAVQLGAVLATALRQPMLLVTAYHHETVAAGLGTEREGENERRFGAAEERVHRAHKLVPDHVEVRERVIPADGIPEALAELAHEVDAAVLVVGRDFDGHVTREVVQHAPCPVAVSPLSVPLPGEEPLRRIGVAFDGSPAARFAVTAAMHLAVPSSAAVDVIAVAGESREPAADPEAAAAPLTEAIESRAVVLRGEPGPALVDVSEGYDLLVCGSRARGRVMSAVLGSVSGHLLRAAHCPILLVPPRVRHRAAAPLGLTTAGG